MLSTVGPQPNQFSRCQSSRSKSLQHHESNSQNALSATNNLANATQRLKPHLTKCTQVTRCPCRRWQGHQHTWSMEGLTLRRELRIQATTSTMLTYTFQKGHLFLIKGSTNNPALPRGYQYVEFRNIVVSRKKNYRFTSVDHLTLSRNALEKVNIFFIRYGSMAVS